MENMEFDPKVDLAVSLFRYENALTQAIFSHYCRFLAQLSGIEEIEIRKQVLAERDDLINEMIKRREG